MKIRCAAAKDVSNLAALEKKTWPSHLTVDETVMIQRIKLFPDGQFVLINPEGQVVGVLFTQRIKAVDQLYSIEYSSLQDIFATDGAYLQLISIAVDTDKCPTGANILREHAIQFALSTPSIHGIVAVTRCQNYFNHVNNIVYQDYVTSLKDPTIFFHTSGGAKIKSILPNYRPEDFANLGNGVLIEYSLLKDVSDISESTIIDYICEMKNWNRDNVHIAESPIMTILDSLELMHLHHWLETKLLSNNYLLPVDFLFRYSTIRQIVQVLPSLFKAESHLVTNDVLSFNNSIKTEGESQVAIIGIGMKLPGDVNTLTDLQELLFSNRCCTTNSLSKERKQQFDMMLSGQEKNHTSSYLQYGGYLSSIDEFDYEFFGLNFNEAKAMDPNQRLLLECTAKAIYDSGRRLEEVSGKHIGVWIGQSNTDFQLISPNVGFRDMSSVYGATGGAASMAAGRISFLLGLHGPSMVIDTACSSSLVAMHQACKSLQSGECAEAIIAASNLILSPWITSAYAKAEMLSPDGKCKTFDEAANGYVRGEGVCAMILKPLSKALEEEDHIYGIIQGSAVMHHGRSPSLTAPNVIAQENLLLAALHNANKSPEDIDFLEVHGTGTKLGDPIEIAALSHVFGSSMSKSSRHFPLYINSIKANIGHLETVAGLAGVLAVLAEFEANKLPSNCQLQQLNSKIRSVLNENGTVNDVSTLAFLQKNYSFPEDKNGNQLVAGVSSFGYSGTIAHIIVEQYRQVCRSPFAIPRPITVTTFSEEYHPVSCPYFSSVELMPTKNSSPQMNLLTIYDRNTLLDHQIGEELILPGAAMINLFDLYHTTSSIVPAASDWKVYHDFIIYRKCIIPTNFDSHSQLLLEVSRGQDHSCPTYIRRISWTLPVLFTSEVQLFLTSLFNLLLLIERTNKLIAPGNFALPFENRYF